MPVTAETVFELERAGWHGGALSPSMCHGMGEPNYASHNYGYYDGTVQSLEAHISYIAVL